MIGLFCNTCYHAQKVGAHHDAVCNALSLLYLHWHPVSIKDNRFSAYLAPYMQGQHSQWSLYLQLYWRPGPWWHHIEMQVGQPRFSKQLQMAELQSLGGSSLWSQSHCHFECSKFLPATFINGYQFSGSHVNSSQISASLSIQGLLLQWIGPANSK